MFCTKTCKKIVNRREGDVRKYFLAAASYLGFGLYFFPWTPWYGFLLSEALEWILHNGPLMCCRDTGGGGASKNSNIYTRGGLIIKNIPPNLSQSCALILQSIFHKHWNERKLNSFQNLIFQNLQ